MGLPWILPQARAYTKLSWLLPTTQLNEVLQWQSDLFWLEIVQNFYHSSALFDNIAVVFGFAVDCF